MEAFGTLTGQLGFPIAAAVYLLRQNKQLTEKYIEMSKQASLDSQSTTLALKEATKMKEKNILQLSKSDNLILRLEAKLDQGS